MIERDLISLKAILARNESLCREILALSFTFRFLCGILVVFTHRLFYASYFLEYRQSRSLFSYSGECEDLRVKATAEPSRQLTSVFLQDLRVAEVLPTFLALHFPC